MAHAFIGTSGWNYRDWRGSFYPEGMPTRRWLSFYATRFDTVEINYTFYRLPSKDACAAWYDQTPEKFRFVVKLSRYITHIKRLRDAEESWDDFIERIAALKHKLGPILLQFPANFRASAANLESVDEFLGYASRDHSRRLALEFRESVLLRLEDAASSAPASRSTGDFAVQPVPVTRSQPNRGLHVFPLSRPERNVRVVLLRHGTPPLGERDKIVSGQATRCICVFQQRRRRPRTARCADPLATIAIPRS